MHRLTLLLLLLISTAKVFAQHPNLEGKHAKQSTASNQVSTFNIEAPQLNTTNQDTTFNIKAPQIKTTKKI